jgi:simple sugar transport system ATP-binding protein
VVPASDRAVSLRGIVKRFGSLTALDAVDFDVGWGEVHAVLGENGAGKTTLMGVLAGFVAPDDGQIEVAGTPMSFSTPREAMDAGIGMVHQTFRLVDRLTVAENLAIGDTSLGWRVDRRDLERRASELAERYGLAVRADAAVWELSVGEQQRVEIISTLALGARIVILDEPTAVLTPQESSALCETMRAIAAQGHAVIFITHKLNEVLEVADRVTVMRRGSRVKTLPRAECDADSLAVLMVGSSSAKMERHPASEKRTADPVLTISDLDVLGDRNLLALRKLSLEVRGGELLGIAGVAGNGQNELAEAITGLRRPTSGTILINGRDMAGERPRAFIDAGVAYIPEDRRHTGLVPSEPIWRNTALKRYRQAPIGRAHVVRQKPAREFAQALCERVGLSTRDIDTPVHQLSGGNAQKLLTGRELEVASTALIAVNPTQGLDVSAVRDVWEALLRARSEGVAVVLISSELDEVFALADRIAVLYEGEIVGELPAEQADRERVGQLMGGAHRTQEAANA